MQTNVLDMRKENNRYDQKISVILTSGISGEPNEIKGKIINHIKNKITELMKKSTLENVNPEIKFLKMISNKLIRIPLRNGQSIYNISIESDHCFDIMGEFKTGYQDEMIKIVDSAIY